MARRACWANCGPLPWYTYPAIEFLSARPFRDRSVREFGGGQSTLRWVACARRDLTIEREVSRYLVLSNFFGFARGVSLRHPTSMFFSEGCFLIKPSIGISKLDVG